MKMNKLVLATLLATVVPVSNSLADQSEPYGMRFDLGGMYQSRGQSYNSIDAFMPMWQDSDTVWFTDLRGVNRIGPALEGNAGTGVRWMNDKQSVLYGLYAFYDYKRTQEHNSFSQITVGSEIKTQNWSYILNGYAPIGATEKDQIVNGSLGLAKNGAYENIIYDDNEEVAMYGVDAEVGYNIPKTDGLTMYAGGYYFTAPNTKVFGGPRTTAEYRLTNSDGSRIWHMFDAVTFELGAQYDNYRRFAWFGGMRLSFGVSDSNRKLTGLAQRMVEYVHRDPDVVTEDKVVDDVALKNPDGSAVNIMDVYNNSELQQALDDPNTDVIAVQGNIAGAGGLVLGNNKYLTGGGYAFYSEGSVHSINLSSGGSITAANNMRTLLSVTDGGIIRDLTFNGDGAADEVGLALQGTSINMDNITLNGFSGNHAAAIKLVDGNAAISDLTMSNNYYGIYSNENLPGYSFNFSGDNVNINNVNQAIHINATNDEQYTVNISSGNITNYSRNAVELMAQDNASITAVFENMMIDGSNSHDDNHQGINISGKDNANVILSLQGTTVRNNSEDGVAVTMADNSHASLEISNSTFDANNRGLDVYANGSGVAISGSIYGSGFTNSANMGARIRSSAGNIALDIRNSDFNNNDTDGLLIDAEGNSVINADIFGSLINDNVTGIDLVNNSTAEMGLVATVDSSTMSGNIGTAHSSGLTSVGSGNSWVSIYDTVSSNNTNGYYVQSTASGNQEVDIHGGEIVGNLTSAVTADSEGESAIVNLMAPVELSGNLVEVNSGQINVTR